MLVSTDLLMLVSTHWGTLVSTYWGNACVSLAHPPYPPKVRVPMLRVYITRPRVSCFHSPPVT